MQDGAGKAKEGGRQVRRGEGGGTNAAAGRGKKNKEGNYKYIDGGLRTGQ